MCFHCRNIIWIKHGSQNVCQNYTFKQIAVSPYIHPINNSNILNDHHMFRSKTSEVTGANRYWDKVSFPRVDETCQFSLNPSKIGVLNIVGTIRSGYETTGTFVHSRKRDLTPVTIHTRYFWCFGTEHFYFMKLWWSFKIFKLFMGHSNKIKFFMFPL